MKNNHREDDEQKTLFQEAAYNKELKWLFAIPNGGKRNVIEAVRLKAQGVKAGVLDMFLPKARGVYHGCYIEMKYGKNKLSDKQKEFSIDVTADGYCVFVCYSSKEASDSLKLYLNLSKGESISSDFPMLSVHHA